jgi:hypothetical protein
MKENTTNYQYDIQIEGTKTIFIQKTHDYGPSWVAFRLTSLTDQMMIKAKRIRKLEVLKGEAFIPEGVESEYRGILNYAVMALLKLLYNEFSEPEEYEKSVYSNLEMLEQTFSEVINNAKELMNKKNHDYGEAWREMRITSITDQILVKLYRIKAIENNDGILVISEGLESHYFDILNYCVFALIKLHEGSNLE